MAVALSPLTAEEEMAAEEEAGDTVPQHMQQVPPRRTLPRRAAAEAFQGAYKEPSLKAKMRNPDS